MRAAFGIGVRAVWTDDQRHRFCVSHHEGRQAQTQLPLEADEFSSSHAGVGGADGVNSSAELDKKGAVEEDAPDDLAAPNMCKRGSHAHIYKCCWHARRRGRLISLVFYALLSLRARCIRLGLLVRLLMPQPPRSSLGHVSPTPLE